MPLLEAFERSYLLILIDFILDNDQEANMMISCMLQFSVLMVILFALPAVINIGTSVPDAQNAFT